MTKAKGPKYLLQRLTKDDSRLSLFIWDVVID
jgi:hypothetical protein